MLPIPLGQNHYHGKAAGRWQTPPVCLFFFFSPPQPNHWFRWEHLGFFQVASKMLGWSWWIAGLCIIKSWWCSGCSHSWFWLGATLHILCSSPMKSRQISPQRSLKTQFSLHSDKVWIMFLGPKDFSGLSSLPSVIANCRWKVYFLFVW